ncbi:dihydrodipicolinate synthase [Buttiauxella ferragutiae ATCC 51602]|jgi:hypothetical protein|uniref:Dihydrodipicolinate synthase n=1 Tax=Buttiauxella ferragutiae ATCC 51602 TaxID=1354252 RepID=A0ABX2WDT0_9ENTR|nr:MULTISPECIES: hypothetical protein [Buttiauxella]AYN27493.1 haloacid dehalogenase-like hydrolase [Buttiauxella sp. 3AFRM03]OAT33302.1 dihydrodipicolinate synthase [Buttiauxella ferragutiae ATCC 51602]TDN48014.1 hypothetical protein EC843_11349 [Buttiauxella sp. JUb87]UNK60590.1 haloacid dehalogenase-like hydrolase [Buttiauxella ferragutiae]
MYKRYLDCNASDLMDLSRTDLLFSLRACEGRILVSETIVTVAPLLTSVTNAELAASQGADLLLLNLFDIENPKIAGMPADTPPEDVIRKLQHLTGRIIGVNLEAVDKGFSATHEELWMMRQGRFATAANARRLHEMGVGFIVLTGNPGNGISNEAIAESLQEIRAELGEDMVLIAGKMHSAGILPSGSQKLITPDDVEKFIQKGADIILLPAPGTVPGITLEYAQKLIDLAHQMGAMTMTAIGTSQEGADAETVRQIALMSKMAGTDLHHIGDTGYTGIAIPENIRTYSIAIRGVRHTYTRIARSVNR